MTGTVSILFFFLFDKFLNQVYVQKYVGDPVAIDWGTQRIKMLDNI